MPLAARILPRSAVTPLDLMTEGWTKRLKLLPQKVKCIESELPPFSIGYHFSPLLPGSEACCLPSDTHITTRVFIERIHRKKPRSCRIFYYTIPAILWGFIGQVFEPRTRGNDLAGPTTSESLSLETAHIFLFCLEMAPTRPRSSYKKMISRKENPTVGKGTAVLGTPNRIL